MYISYTYDSGAGINLAVANPRMGVAPVFQVVLSQPFDGREQTFIFNRCQASKLSVPTKQDDFQINEMDFMAFPDIAGNLGTINVNL